MPVIGRQINWKQSRTAHLECSRTRSHMIWRNLRWKYEICKHNSEIIMASKCYIRNATPETQERTIIALWCDGRAYLLPNWNNFWFENRSKCKKCFNQQITKKNAKRQNQMIWLTVSTKSEPNSNHEAECRTYILIDAILKTIKNRIRN